MLQNKRTRLGNSGGDLSTSSLKKYFSEEMLFRLRSKAKKEPAMQKN